MKQRTMANVFIIDDSKIQTLLLEKVLTREGYNVQTFSDGYEMLNTIESEVPGLIISDIEMPTMDGFTLFEKLRQKISDWKIPFFFISSHGDHATLEKVEETGADLFFQKPIKSDMLLQVLPQFLGSPAQA